MSTPLFELTKNAPLGAFDARARLLTCLIFSVTTAFLSHLYPALAALLIVTLLIPFSGLPRTTLFHKLLAVNAFIAFLWVFTPFTTPGETLYSVGALSVTDRGVAIASLVTLKCNAIFIAFLTLVAPMRPSVFARAMQGLGLPVKLVTLFLFTSRHIDVFRAEIERLHCAAKLRGFIPSTNLHTYRTMAAFVGLSLVQAVEKSHRIDEAMRLRGFDGELHTIVTLKAHAKDAILIVTALILAIGLATLNLLIGGL